MIERLMFRAAWKDGLQEEGIAALQRDEQVIRLVKQGSLMTAAAFYWNYNLFLYFECLDGKLAPEEVAGAAKPYLMDWPGQEESRKWIQMMDVFHFNEPANREHWLRKQPVEGRVGRVAHLKPEMISSYVYYHYQLQEERAFFGPKYEIIGIHENLLFGYQEFPNVTEEPIVPGRLQTKGTPENWSDSRMDLHFQPWEDGHLYFKPIEWIYAYYIGDIAE